MIDSYELFKEKVLQLTKIDLNYYKERQMKRRIDSLITKYKITSYKEYVEVLKSNKIMFDEFLSYITINVSEFYRNPEQWEILEKEILPAIISRSSNLKIWSAACSTGDEPYSLVMLLTKFFPLNKIKVLATDIDKQVLEKAKAGFYHEKSLSGLPKEFKSKYFTQINSTTYQISDSIKACVEFNEHNLLKDPYPSGVDLIVCRNVLIYFTEEAKNLIYNKFNQALKQDGVLFVGSTEQIIQPSNMGYKSSKSFFYKKI